MSEMNTPLPVQNIRSSIDEYIATSQATSSIEKGRAFLRWLQENLLPEFDPDDVMVLDGCNDKGFDFVGYAAGELWAIQAKFDSAHNMDAVEAFHSRSQHLRAGLNGKQLVDNPNIFTFIESRIGTDRDKAECVLHCCYITSNNFVGTQPDRINVLHKNSPYIRFFDLTGITEYIRQQQSSEIGGVGSLSFSPAPIFTEDRSTVVGVCTLASLASFANKCGALLFDANVRSYLKRTSVNRDIAETLQSNPENFFYYNNGVTLVCKSIEPKGTANIYVTGAQVVNGCQTINEILRAWETKQSSLKGSVLVRIITASAVGMRQKISATTNRQNAVRNRDFLSMADDQRAIQKSMNRLGYYYEYRRGTGALLPNEQRAAFKGRNEFRYLERSNWKFRKIAAFDCQQCFLAAYVDRPGLARDKLGQLNPLDPEYGQLFDPIHTLDPLHHLLPFLIHEAAAQKDYGVGGTEWRSNARLYFVSAAYRVLWQVIAKSRPGFDACPQIRSPHAASDELKVIIGDEEAGRLLLDVADAALDRYKESLEEMQIPKKYHSRNSFRRDDHIEYGKARDKYDDAARWALTLQPGKKLQARVFELLK